MRPRPSFHRLEEYLYEDFDGVDWERTGIVPDLNVPTQKDQITLEDVPAVEAALEYFDSR